MNARDVFDNLRRLTFASLPGVLIIYPAAAAPTGMREWKSSTGTSISADATELSNGVAVLQTAASKTVRVPLEKFAKDDQEFLQKHFGAGPAVASPAVSAAAGDDSITLPKGKAQGPISAGEGSSYHLYIPKSLPKGRKHPLMMILDPHHGKNGTLTRYIPGAERNGWILITSVESDNDLSDKMAGPSIIKDIEHAKSTLPVDPKRIFIGGFSGGSSRGFGMASEIQAAGVLGCGMGGAFGGIELKRDVPIYILSGSNCWDRQDPGATLAKFCPKSKDSLARYFPGGHAWADAELMEDAMTHLNAVMLSARRDSYREEAYQNEAAILRFAEELKGGKPARALMWTTFLTERPADSRLMPAVAKLHAELSAKPEAVRWVEGLQAIHRFAVDKLGKAELRTLGSGWNASTKDIEKLGVEFADTPWKETLDRMLKPVER